MIARVGVRNDLWGGWTWRRQASVGGAVVALALAALSLGAAPAFGFDEKCESAPAVGYPVSRDEVDATEACYDAFDIGQSTQLNGLRAFEQGCTSTPASDLSKLGAGLQKTSATGLTNVQKATKVKVKYFAGEQEQYAKRRQTVVAARLGNIGKRLRELNDAVVAVWTQFENVATALSDNDCGSVSTAIGKATEDWGTENSANSDLATAVNMLLGRGEQRP